MHFRSNLTYLLVFLGFVAGCGKSDRDLLDQYYSERKEVVALGGIITVDGKPVNKLSLRLVPADSKELRGGDHKTFTDENGCFAFSTYLDGDGVPPGSYLLLVEQLKSVGRGQWIGPDGLKNLYNSLNSPAAKLEVNEPQEDLLIELELAEKSGKKSPGSQNARVGGRPPKSRSSR